MPHSSAWALQEAIHQRLTADASLTTLLGGPRIYDHVPRNTAYPILTFGQSVAREWATGTEDGEEHVLTLHVWSDGGSRQQAHDIMGAVKRVLNQAALPLNDHRLVDIRHEFSEARPEPDRESYHGIVRYRAVTEPVN
jgi:Protein of unknown function (DUF3168)